MNFKIYDKSTKTMSDVFEVSELTDWKLIWSDRFNGQNQISFCDLIWLKGSGLCDENGVEIFEGDLVTMTSYNYSFLNSHLFKVFYDKRVMRFEFIDVETKRAYTKDGFCNLKKVGNEYETPDLIGAVFKS